MVLEHVEFDHLLHWVPDVPAAAERYTAAGFPAQAGQVQAGFINGGWRMDVRYVEILSVVDEEALLATPTGFAWEQLQAAAVDPARRGGGAMTFAVSVPDATASARALRAAGHRVVDVTVPYDEVVGFHEVFLPDTPAWAPFLITYTPPRHEIIAALPDGAFDPGPHRLAAIVVQCPDPAGSARWLGDLLGIAADETVVPLSGGRVVFERGAAERITQVRVTGPDVDVEIDGLRITSAAD